MNPAIDINKSYTPEEALALNIKIDMFGFPIVDKARDMRDFFLIPPFSIINTMEKNWLARRKRWEALINDNGESRQNTLMKKSDTESEVGKQLQEFNDGVSILDACLAEILVKWFAVTGFKAFDPFAGDTIFGYVASYLGLQFTGIELRKEQADLNNQRVHKEFPNSFYHNDTSVNMDAYVDDNTQDFIFTCPPYIDLEVYSDDPRDLSTMGHKGFFPVYMDILIKTYRKLKNDRFAAVVVSEVRDPKTGFYSGLVPKTIGIMEKAGYRYYNEIILVNSVGTLPLRAGRTMNSGRKVGRHHQNILIFFKGDPNNIKNVYPVLAPPNNYYS